MTIHNTTLYDSFSHILGNRLVSTSKVKKLVEDVEAGLDLFKYCPIIVSDDSDGKFKIIDGQHRFKACVTLNLPIYYVVAHDIKLRDIARMNSNTDKWRFKDFAECYVNLGLVDYIQFTEFITKYKINYAPAIGLLYFNSALAHGYASEKFKDGEFKIKYLQEATEIMELVNRLFSKFTFWHDRNLIHAVLKLQEKGIWEIERFEEKLNKNPNSMSQCSSYKTYILLIEQIYNMHTQNRKIIF